jgi:pimeloyl-ACP methyl ester carboxylesterase
MEVNAMFYKNNMSGQVKPSHGKINSGSKKKQILKFFLIGIGAIMSLIIALFIWIYLSRFSGPGAMELSEYHPFRSPETQERYLQFYDEKSKNWPVTSQTKMVETPYGQTFVRISGPDQAPPLVLLHGGGANSLMWIPNIEGLSESYRTYAVDDIYGYGRSLYLRKMRSGDDIVIWLNELFTALELGDSINLVGLSYGGWQASQYALRFANRLDKIVLIAPAATILPLSKEWINRAVLMIVPHRYFVKSMFFWILEDLVKKDEAGKILVENWVDEIFLASKCFKFKMLVSPTVLVNKELQSLRLPTLFLVGENEKIYSAQKAVQRLNNVAPHLKTEILPNCGHDLWIVQAETVNKIILQFLKQSG